MLRQRCLYIQKRNQCFHFRMPIPEDLKSQYGCRELTKSLRTHQESIAVHRCLRLTEAATKLFQWIRQGSINESIRETSQNYLNRVLNEISYTQVDEILSESIKELEKSDACIFSELFNNWLKEKKIASKTNQSYLQSRDLWIASNKDVNIAEITKKNGVIYKKYLMRLPKNQGVSLKRTGNDNNEAHRSNIISITRINFHLSTINSFFLWCIRHGYFNEPSPVYGLKIKQNTSDKEERLPYSTDQLTQFFNSPIYTGCESPGRRTRPGKLVIKDSLYWIPLIAYLSGMRMNEICQLAVSNLKKEGDIWYFQIDDSLPNQSLKNKHSRRVIPVHPELIRRGFLEYSSKLSANGRLFPDVPLGSDGSYSYIFSKRYRYVEGSLGLKTPRTSFHSFRHNFIDALKNAGEQDSVIKALVGHRDASMTFGRYGSGFSLERLYEVVCQISYMPIFFLK